MGRVFLFYEELVGQASDFYTLLRVTHKERAAKCRITNSKAAYGGILPRRQRELILQNSGDHLTVS
jgi:tRNA A22 N-methylase